MKKFLILTSLTVMMLTLFIYTKSAMGTSPTQPTFITDRLLLKAWNQLDHHTEAIPMPDGSTLSGHELAQFVLENNIPIVWGPHPLCGYTSCTIEYHQGDLWIHDRPDEIDPIYINTSLNTPASEDIDELVESIAHEIFHYSEPFGHVQDTRYEEFLAFYVSASIVGKAWTKDASLDPLNPANLTQWFLAHNLQYGYSTIPLYPESVLVLVNCTAPGCNLAETQMSQSNIVSNPENQTGLDYHKLQAGQTTNTNSVSPQATP